ncbi:MAG: TrmB family transcriptional regulator [Candidatus Hermodarchaeota archaeon]
MSEDLITELKEFLKSLKISTYEVNSYISLLPTKNLTAREISKESGVPSGRIYEVLEDLKEKGMIRIDDSRPKRYSPISPNLALHNLINHLKDENQKQISLLINKAKKLETQLYKSNLVGIKESSRIFWSTALGYYAIESLYLRCFRELEEELLLTIYLNRKTVKRIQFLKRISEELFKALKRGVNVKFLFSFDFGDFSYSDSNEIGKKELYLSVVNKLEELYGLSEEIDGFEMKYTLLRNPTYYDIFDKKRIILKLQNPLNPSDIFACLNVLDPKLAKELRKKYLNLWLFESKE